MDKPAVVFGCPFGFTKLGGSSTAASTTLSKQLRASPHLCVKQPPKNETCPAFPAQVKRDIQEYTAMSEEKPPPSLYFGLDIHKHYLVASAVDTAGDKVYGPRRVAWEDLESWRKKTLTPQDAVVLEMTTNTWQVYDELQPYVHSVTVVHPPQVRLVTEPKVMTDKIAALNLAVLLSKGMLKGIWVPPQEVRERRALLAQRSKLTRLSTQAKNRLHAVLHRHHLLPSEGDIFNPERRAWWLSLPVSAVEKVRLLSDLDTLAFARQQIANLEACLHQIAAQDLRVHLLLQLPGIGIVNSLTILAAIGEISRFPDAKHLVGYAGLGARVHDSGLSPRTGKITKEGRRDLRSALVEAAQVAANTHPYWKSVFARLEPRLGRNKAIVAMARKLLVAVWHLLTHQAADRYAEEERVARKFLQIAYHLGQAHRQPGQSPAAFARKQLDRLGLGQSLTHVGWGVKKKPIPLPPSSQPDNTV
jgi:transposase